MNIPYVMRQCTKCGEWKVASSINFYRQKSCKYGLQSQCKKCMSKYGKQWREANKEKIAMRDKQYRENNKEKITEYQKQWHEANKDKVCERSKQYREANKDKIAKQKKQWYEANKKKELERVKQWYENNKEKELEYQKQYRKNNKDKIAERQKRYREKNKEKIAEYHKQYGKRYRENNKEKIAEHKKQYYQTPQGQVAIFNGRQRRRAKEEQQGAGITKDQWLEMMKFFDFRCAYSGERLTKDNRTIDHIVPLNSNGDNMVWNMVPMARSYNSSKQDKDMLEWYREQDFYSEDRLEKIYKWQEYAYNKYGKDSEYFNSGNIQIKLI